MPMLFIFFVASIPDSVVEFVADKVLEERISD